MGYHTCLCDSGSRRFDGLEAYEELPNHEDDLSAFQRHESWGKNVTRNPNVEYSSSDSKICQIQ